jgi:hypothetical protein
VALAGTAPDGLRLAQSEPFDIYLLDTRLPEESGDVLELRFTADYKGPELMPFLVQNAKLFGMVKAERISHKEKEMILLEVWSDS